MGKEISAMTSLSELDWTRKTKFSVPSSTVKHSPLKMGLTQPSMQWVPRAARSVYSGQAVILCTDIISFLEQECKELYLHIAVNLHTMALRQSSHTLYVNGPSGCVENELGLRIEAVDHIQRKPAMFPRGYLAVFLGLCFCFIEAEVYRTEA
jgi:hypothetical protein